MTQCTHLDTIEITELPEEVAGCEDCLATGGVWLHLRICLDCGHVGCCDDSPNKHASAHAARASTRSSARWSRARTGAGASRTRSGCGSRRSPGRRGSRPRRCCRAEQRLGGGEHAALAPRRAGELHADRQAEVVEADRHGARRQAGEVLRDGEGQHAVAEGLRADAARLRRQRRGSASAAGRPAANRRAKPARIALARRGRLDVVLERDRARALEARRDVRAVLVPARGVEVGVGERGLDALDRRRTRGRCARPPRRRARRRARARAAACVERALDARRRAGAGAGRGRPRSAARRSSRRARAGRAPRRSRRTSAGVRAIGPTWSSERASGKTPVAGIRL